MKNPEKIHMTFTCDQDWDAMRITSCGRYCEVCQKEVLDFTNKTKSEIQHHQSTSGELCGRFKPEQVDDTLIKPIKFSLSKKFILYFTGLLLSVISPKKSVAQSKDSVKTEQTVATTKEAAEKCTSTLKEKDNTRIDSDTSDDPFLTIRRREFYWSKRFPFIKVVKMHVMGRYSRFL